MENVCPILGDVLYMAFDVMDSPSSVWVLFTEILAIDHLEIRLYSGVWMDPKVYKTI